MVERIRGAGTLMADAPPHRGVRGWSPGAPRRTARRGFPRRAGYRQKRV